MSSARPSSGCAGEKPDPKLAQMRADLDLKIKTAQQVSAQVFQQLAESGAIMLVQMAALKALESNMAAKSIASMKSEGLFHPAEGVEPHYDPKTGTIRGDEAKLGKLKPDEVAKLKNAYATSTPNSSASVSTIASVASPIPMTADDAARS